MANKLKKILEPPKSPFDKDKEKPVAFTQAPPQATQSSASGQAEILRDQYGKEVGIISPEGVVLPGLDRKQMYDLKQLYASRAGGGALGAPGIVEHEDVQKLQQQKQIKQEVMAAEEPQPKELSPSEKGYKYPVPPGAGGAANVAGLYSIQLMRKYPTFKKLIAKSTEGILEPETDIEEMIFNEGINRKELLGAAIEGIPGLGAAARRYAKGLATSPSGEVDDLREKVNLNVEQAGLAKDRAKNGLKDPQDAIREIETLELDIQKLEAKMKLLIAYSAVLTSSPEEVNNFETELLITKKKLLGYKGELLML